jgi:hypothetical protein
MSIVANKNAFVNSTATSIGLSEMFNVTAGSSNPAYLVLTVLDRNEYTAGSSGATGTLSGNGHTLSLSSLGGDARGTGLVFTYQGSSGRYYNSTFGYLDQLTYNSSGSRNDVTNLSLFGTSNLSQANSYATSAYAMMQVAASGYLGSATVVTQPQTSGAVPAQATPYSIAAVANGFVGKAWNMNGCWVLASTIAADAGASLPVQSTAIGLPGVANGEWIVAFNGPSGQSGNWQSLVKAGEVIVIGTAGGGGHITTCVSGSGSNALLVDNATYVNGSGQVTNLANDGSSSDIIVASPHAASQEWAGVAASSVVIYELDTPIVAGAVAFGSLALRASQSLGSLFTASDPANKPITQWQVYDTASSDMLVLNGASYNDHSAASALTAASLASISLLAGSIVTTDTVEVRAYNGTYWGDWTSLSLVVSATAQSAPVLTTQTPAQTWRAGAAISLAPAFTDPQGQTLTYGAQLASGQALPSWLVFNAANDTFSGTAPTIVQILNIVVTATDAGHSSATDTFSAAVLGAPVLMGQTPNQIWVEGKPVSLVLPANAFVDPQGQKLTYAASLSGGQALPGWLSFNATTETFSGLAPTTAQSLSIKVTATDSGGLASSESFAAGVQPTPAARPGITVSNPMPNQTWTDGQNVALVLPTNTFTDALGLKMTFAAYQVSGPNETEWLRFNAAAHEFLGKVPMTASGSFGLLVMATDALSMAVSDVFSVTFTSGSAHVTAALTAGLLGSGSLSTPETMLGLLALHS